MKSLNSLTKALLNNKRVIVRADLDVPIQNGVIQSAVRLNAIRDTLDYLLLRDAKVILIGHMGRPDGKVVEELRLNPIADYLASLGYNIAKLNEVSGQDSVNASRYIDNGSILLLENLRFDPREEKNDESLARELAALADIYVNESFATSHRAHASMVSLPLLMNSYPGLRLEREIEVLRNVINKPEKPLVAIIGGAKIETKLPVISKFLSVADYVILGGKLGLYYEGDNNFKVLVPQDYVGPNKEDVGPTSVKMFTNIIKMAKTIIWNGPMGKFEDPQYLQATKDIANAIIDSGAYSVVGGGDTIDALEKIQLQDKMKFISVGGGAMLDFISGKSMPGLNAIGFYE